MSRTAPRQHTGQQEQELGSQRGVPTLCKLCWRIAWDDSRSGFRHQHAGAWQRHPLAAPVSVTGDAMEPATCCSCAGMCVVCTQLWGARSWQQQQLGAFAPLLGALWPREPPCARPEGATQHTGG